MQTLHALDLTESPGASSLWRRRRDSHGEPARALPTTASDLDLPVQGFPSPFGFWFAEGPSWTTAPPRLTVEFFEVVDPERANRTQHGPIRESPSSFRTIRARPKALAGRARDRKSTLPLMIEVDSDLARIRVDAATWATVGETVLFVVAQYWRFAAIDRALDELSDWARNDLEKNTGFVSMLSRRRASNLRDHRRELEKLILDLPDFEGPLTNPNSHLPAGRAVALYRGLCSLLGLYRRRREIDERIEVVESIFDSLTESLNHFQSLAFQIVLELIIVTLLLLDVGVYFWDAIARHGP
jgi:hypothetical protein